MNALSERRYRDETLRLIARRGPVALIACAVGVGIADVLESYYQPERALPLAVVSAVEFGICLAAWRLYAVERLRPYLVEFTQATGALLLLCIVLYFEATGASATGLALVVLVFELITAVMFPWGLRGQMPMALALVGLYVGYLLVAEPAAGAGLPVSYGLLAVLFGATLSVLGALFLDRQRFAIFARREELDRHIATFRNLTQTFHGFDPQRVFLVACISTLQDFFMRRLWAVWQAPGGETVQGYAARRDGEGVTMESLSDPAPLWTALGEWGSSSEAFVAAAGDRRIPSPLHQAGATSVLCIPLRFEGEALGAILADRGGEVFQLDAAARVVASILGSGTAIAMANARLYHKAMAASEEKSTFLARIAHDLRNPLHSMLWDLDTLEREGRGPHAVIDRLRQNAHMTLRGAEELQEFSEIETRRLTMHNEDVSLPRIFDELRITATALLAERPVAFRSRVARDARILRTDPVRLRQVLGNLLSNAVKFTIRGEVRLEAVRSGEHIVISVSDTGVGIEADEVREIFTPFYRGSARSTAARGMGLGLAIAQEIAGFLGGRIEVRSTVGAGSTFSVALPVRASAAGVAGEQQRDAGGRRSAA